MKTPVFPSPVSGLKACATMWEFLIWFLRIKIVALMLSRHVLYKVILLYLEIRFLSMRLVNSWRSAIEDYWILIFCDYMSCLLWQQKRHWLCVAINQEIPNTSSKQSEVRKMEGLSSGFTWDIPISKPWLCISCSQVFKTVNFQCLTSTSWRDVWGTWKLKEMSSKIISTAVQK